MFKYCVIEYERKESNLILSAATLSQSPTKKVWEILYGVEFEPMDDVETHLAFDACQVWVEKNRNPGSKYVIMEMFFVE